MKKRPDPKVKRKRLHKKRRGINPKKHKKITGEKPWNSK